MYDSKSTVLIFTVLEHQQKSRSIQMHQRFHPSSLASNGTPSGNIPFMQCGRISDIGLISLFSEETKIHPSHNSGKQMIFYVWDCCRHNFTPSILFAKSLMFVEYRNYGSSALFSDLCEHVTC